MEIKNISKIKNCYGCGVCSAACPKKIISIDLNRNGFYEPHIKDLNKCINCKICLDVCAFNHKELSLKTDEKQIHSWAAWSNDENVRKRCSSGGIGFEIGKQLLESGYHTVGCRYNINKQRAEHYIATTIEELTLSIGSKYIQSYTEEAFKHIKRKGQKYLVVGTPCQIDSFRRMIRKFHCEENFILMDFYCHCVPSMWAWEAYIKALEPKTGKITYVAWRNKIKYDCNNIWMKEIDVNNTATKTVDWHDSYNMLIKGEKKIVQSRLSQGDLFYNFFLGDMALGSQCIKDCKYKYDKSSADIRIGDLWGKTYKENQKGVSALIAFTSKGKDIVENLKEITLVRHPFEIVAEGQMVKNAKPSLNRPLIMGLFRNKIYLSEKGWKFLFIFLNHFWEIVFKIKRIIKS